MAHKWMALSYNAYALKCILKESLDLVIQPMCEPGLYLFNTWPCFKMAKMNIHITWTETLCFRDATILNCLWQYFKWTTPREKADGKKFLSATTVVKRKIILYLAYFIKEVLIGPIVHCCFWLDVYGLRETSAWLLWMRANCVGHRWLPLSLCHMYM